MIISIYIYARSICIPSVSREVITLASSIEIIHTASLVHDDILDDAEERRSQQAMHRIFGPDVAVLSGDFLFAHASGLIESLEDDEVTRLAPRWEIYGRSYYIHDRYCI